jgi:uncharacterized protein YkwD
LQALESSSIATEARHRRRERPLKAKLTTVLLLAVVLLALTPTAALASFSAATYRANLQALINHYRANHGLATLKVNLNLQRAASAHSGNMATHHMLSHSSYSGMSWSQRIRWYGYKGSWIGENLAVGLWTPRDTLRAWINSAPHRANLLGSHYRVIGIGVSKGVWSGRSAYYITADFGGP